MTQNNWQDRINKARQPIAIQKDRQQDFDHDEMSVLLKKIGLFYGMDPEDIAAFRKKVFDDPKKTQSALIRLQAIEQDIDSRKDPNDKRVFCKDCNKFGQDQSCACAKNGSMGAHLARFKPAPYVPRTCNDFALSPHPMDFPPPPNRIRVMMKDPKEAHKYGYHPHDERWIKELVQQPDIPDPEKIRKEYEKQFRALMESPEAPKTGKEGYARRLCNIWLREEVDRVRSVGLKQVIAMEDQKQEQATPGM